MIFIIYMFVISMILHVITVCLSNWSVCLFIFIFFPNVLLHYKMVAIYFYININRLIFCAIIVYISNWFFKMLAIYIYVCILFHYFNLRKNTSLLNVFLFTSYSVISKYMSAISNIKLLSIYKNCYLFIFLLFYLYFIVLKMPAM